MLLVSGLVSVPKPLSQIQRSTLWLLQGLSPRTSFGGFGLNRRLAESDALRQVAAAINSVMEVQPLLEMIMEKSKEVMDAEASSLMLLDEETQELVFNVATGEKGAALREIRLPLGRGIAGWVAQNKEPLLVPDAYEDPCFNRDADKMSGFHTRSILCVPLMMQDRLLGVVQVLNPNGKDSFEENDRGTFTSFADHASIAIENARALRGAEATSGGVARSFGAGTVAYSPER